MRIGESRTKKILDCDYDTLYVLVRDLHLREHPGGIFGPEYDEDEVAALAAKREQEREVRDLKACAAMAPTLTMNRFREGD